MKFGIPKSLQTNDNKLNDFDQIQCISRLLRFLCAANRTFITSMVISLMFIVTAYVSSKERFENAVWFW